MTDLLVPIKKLKKLSKSLEETRGSFNLHAQLLRQAELADTPECMFAAELKQAKLAVTLTFITNGLAVGSFIPRIPDIKAHFDISNATLGTALLSSSIGVFLALGPSGKLSAKYGSAPIAFWLHSGFSRCGDELACCRSRA